MIELARPELLLLGPFFLALTLMSQYFAQKIKRNLEVFHYPPTWRLMRLVAKKRAHRHSWRGVNLALKIIIVMLITFSLSSPFFLVFSETTQTFDIPVVEEKDLVGGIILAVDVSGSMGLQDVTPSRLDVAKNILVEFVKNSSDRVRFGVVAFDTEIIDSFPLTENKENVTSTLSGLTASEALPCLEEFTDIGYGLQTSLDLLAPYATSMSNKTYAIILLSDGYSNYGYPDPVMSAALATQRAVQMRVPVYALHVARMGQDSNPGLMRIIAEETQGKFMDSTSAQELRDVLSTIGKYHAPTNPWSAKVEVRVTTPSRIELTPLIMSATVAIILVLWTGNYKHYKTAF